MPVTSAPQVAPLHHWRICVHEEPPSMVQTRDDNFVQDWDCRVAVIRFQSLVRAKSQRSTVSCVISHCAGKHFSYAFTCGPNSWLQVVLEEVVVGVTIDCNLMLH